MSEAPSDTGPVERGNVLVAYIEGVDTLNVRMV